MLRCASMDCSPSVRQLHLLVRPLPATRLLRRGGLTFRILPSAGASSARAWYKSQRCCMFIQKSGVIPKNFASRKAVLGVIPRRPLTSSLTRWYGTLIPSARSRCESPIGLRNSSSSISPGWIGARCVGIRTMVYSLVIVDNLYCFWPTIGPNEANTILIIDPNAVLAHSRTM